MKTSTARKVGLFVLFGAAIFIMIAACLRVYFVVAVWTTPSPVLLSCSASNVNS